MWSLSEAMAVLRGKKKPRSSNVNNRNNSAKINILKLYMCEVNVL